VCDLNNGLLKHKLVPFCLVKERLQRMAEIFVKLERVVRIIRPKRALAELYICWQKAPCL
jgi:hypothetical protein